MTNFEQWLKAQGLNKSTAKSYAKQKEAYKNWLKSPITESGYNELIDYLSYLKEKGLSRQTRQNYLGGLKYYYHYIGKEPNPAKGIKIRGSKRVQLYGHLLTEKEIETLYTNYPKSSNKERFTLSLLCFQGLRLAEIRLLKSTDIQNTKIEIPQTQTGNSRYLPLHAEQLNLLYTSEENLFARGISEKWLNNRVTNIFKKLKQQGYQINSLILRASVITNWLKKYKLRETQYRAGHRYISSTEHYQLTLTDELQKSLEQYHPHERN